jgi:hypothetical protein
MVTDDSVCILNACRGGVLNGVTVRTGNYKMSHGEDRSAIAFLNRYTRPTMLAGFLGSRL